MPIIAKRSGRDSRLAAALAVAALLVTASEAMAVDVSEGQTAPPFSLPDGAGNTISFPAVADGRPVVVFFWATWCPYSRALTPLLGEIRRDYAERGVQVLALNVREDGDPVAYLRERDADFVLLTGADAVAQVWGVTGTPGLFVVDGDGTVVYRRRSSGDRKPREAAAIWAERARVAIMTALEPDKNRPPGGQPDGQ